jgi:hypothetical protein
MPDVPEDGGAVDDVAGGEVDVAGGGLACVLVDEPPLPLLPPQATATTENTATTSRIRM